ncbi:MAG: hypothetical protein ABL966_15400, partial [Acidimicrobiales bacterium]
DYGGDDWQTPYLLFNAALTIAAILTLATVLHLGRDAETSRWRRIGLAVCGLGLVSTLVAWALPLWMTLLGVGFGLVAMSVTGALRRPLALLAGAQVLGLVSLLLALRAEIGPVDEYGDHPAAFGVGLVVTAGAMIGALLLADRVRSASPTAPVAALP